VSVWASEALAIGPQAVAALFVVSGLAGALGNPLIGLLSDRFGWRRGIIIGQLAVTSLALMGRTLVTDYAVAMGLVAFSGFGITGLVLAAVNDLARAMPESEKRNTLRILAVERAAWSMGIIVGPAIAAAIVSTTGATQPVFAAAALIQVAAIGMVWTVRTRAGPRAKGAGQEVGDKPLPIRRVPLAVAFAALVLIMLPAQTRNVYLPLFVTTLLGEPAGMVGPLFTLVAILAVATMPYVGAAADRFGAQRVLYTGALVGAGYCALQSISTGYLQTLALQPLLGIGIALWNTSTLIYLQQAMPGRAGSAGGLYVSVQQVTPIIAGLVLGPIAETAGIPAAFGTTAALCLVALVLLARAHRALVERALPRSPRP
jgi:SET family sugar efflux transporter-like MFS transporter